MYKHYIFRVTQSAKPIENMKWGVRFVRTAITGSLRVKQLPQSFPKILLNKINFITAKNPNTIKKQEYFWIYYAKNGCL